MGYSNTCCKPGESSFNVQDSMQGIQISQSSGGIFISFSRCTMHGRKLIADCLDQDDVRVSLIILSRVK